MVSRFSVDRILMRQTADRTRREAGASASTQSVDNYAVARAQLASLRKRFGGVAALAAAADTGSDNINQLARPGSERRVPRDLCIRLGTAESSKFGLDPVENVKKWLARWGYPIDGDAVLEAEIGLPAEDEDAAAQLRLAIDTLDRATGKAYLLDIQHLALAASCRMSQISAKEEFDKFLRDHPTSEVFLVYRWRGIDSETKGSQTESLRIGSARYCIENYACVSQWRAVRVNTT